MTVPTEGEEEGEQANPGPADQRRALVVEDFSQLRELLMLGLRDAGYAVDGAGSVAQALSMRPESYDVLVSDLRLADGYGTDLLDAVRARDPSVLGRCLLMTGGGVGHELPAGVPVLVKPFGIDTLVQSVRDLLEGRRPTN